MSKEIMKSKIKKAQKEIETKKDIVKNGKMRQYYHFMPQTGWMNDPNGLIYYQNKYHFFFQSNPYDGFWGSMHWGHAVSEDMLHWEYLPLALAPSEEYDDHLKGGCFSGTAIVYDDKLYIMYTGTTNEGNGFEQTQCIAYSEDGVHFTKYEGNPVITAPEGVARDCFRDPKVWEHEGRYYMVCGASKDNRGMALLYQSDDMLHWEFFNVLAESRGEYGYMWECPDFFKLGNKYVLTFSPMGSGDHTAVYMTGDFDYKTGKFEPLICKEIDWGFDFYAPQSLETPDGRRIMVGWANEWEWMPQWKDWGPTYKEGWCGFFNIPREVRIKKDGTLQFLPIKELENIRKNKKILNSISLEKEQEIQVDNGISYEMKFKIDLEETTAEYLELDLRCGENKAAKCIFDLEMAELRVNRDNADGWSKGTSRSVLFLKDKKELDVHVFVDQSSIEIFTSDYQNNHSNNVFAGKCQNQLWIRTTGGKAVLKNIEIYELRNCYL